MNAEAFVIGLAEATRCGLVEWIPSPDGAYEARNGDKAVRLRTGGGAVVETVEGGAALAFYPGAAGHLLAECVLDVLGEPRRLARAGMGGASVNDLVNLALRLTLSGEMRWERSGRDTLRARIGFTGPAFTVRCADGSPYDDPQCVQVEAGGESFLRSATLPDSPGAALARAAAATVA